MSSAVLFNLVFWGAVLLWALGAMSTYGRHSPYRTRRSGTPDEILRKHH